jgi:maleylpyruvate isomerase
MPVPSARLELMRRGEVFFVSQLASLDDTALAMPCGLPGWTRSHLAAHVARNADALVNLLTWARTGVETPMYTSPEQRATDIEASARQQPAALRADVKLASDRLVASATSLDDDRWDVTVRTARGRSISAEEVPWMRIRETWVHGVDLSAGASFVDILPEVVAELVDEVASGLMGREECPPMLVSDTERSRSWRIGPADDAVEVAGPPGELLSWLIGRDAGATLKVTSIDGRPPSPPSWL